MQSHLLISTRHQRFVEGDHMKVVNLPLLIRWLLPAHALYMYKAFHKCSWEFPLLAEQMVSTKDVDKNVYNSKSKC